MRRVFLSLVLLFAVTRALLGQQGTQANQGPPRSDAPAAGESSSKDTKIPLGEVDGAAPEAPDPTITEAKPWNPHKSAKSTEIGDYYFKRKNYRAAESRYREALEYKPNDAIATFKLAQTMEKQGNLTQARQGYAEYLRIVPHGELAGEAKKSIARIEKDEH